MRWRRLPRPFRTPHRESGARPTPTRSCSDRQKQTTSSAASGLNAWSASSSSSGNGFTTAALMKPGCLDMAGSQPSQTASVQCGFHSGFRREVYVKSDHFTIPLCICSLP